MRVIAIGDYFSQSVLRPLHKDIFRVLRRISQDCTFDQGKRLQELASKPGPFYSLDLSNATDRFPVDLIASVLKGHYASEYVDAWKNIMVAQSFHTPDGGEEVRYAVGNPMGFYSSWNSFALAHHFVVFSACQLSGVQWKTLDYCLLGDDVVIANEKIALKYKELMEGLGVDISPRKTHVSMDTFEFAKR